MIKVLSFDLGHTILDERVGRDIGMKLCPAIPMLGVEEVLPKIRLPMALWANTQNATASDVKDWLSRAALDQYFTWIVTSSDIGYRKPDKRFFKSALNACGCNPDEVLFVGNQKNSDIKGANLSGIPCVLLTGSVYRSSDDSGDPTAIPTFKIEHLGELLKLLAELRIQDSA
jgi:putative hydrolase of the HAD superfamily